MIIEPTPEPVPVGYRRDQRGNLIAEANISPAELLEDQTVEKIHGFAEVLSAQIARFKGHCFDDVGAFLTIIGEQYGDKRGGAKGNMTLTTFDGKKKVQIQVAERLTFGPQLMIAKNLVDECIRTWAEGASANIRVLVDQAFDVDKEGKVNREALFRLRRLNIDDERWQRAMQALTDSIRVEGSTVYVRFYRRPSARDRWQAVTIDLASAEAPSAPQAPAA